MVKSQCVDRHDITEIVLKVALNSIIVKVVRFLNLPLNKCYIYRIWYESQESKLEKIKSNCIISHIFSGVISQICFISLTFASFRNFCLAGVISQNFVVFQVVTQKPMLILAYKRFVYCNTTSAFFKRNMILYLRTYTSMEVTCN
jgi:hypothetical protein